MKQTKTLKLYDLPRDAGIKIDYADLKLEFHHLDGMYSYCTLLEGKSKGEPFHLSASAPLREIERNHYEVIL